MESHEFREGMRKLAGGVTIVTSVDAEGRRCGLTATAVCSLSVEPPFLVTCINQSSSVAAVVESSRVFAVNVLSLRQMAVAEVFAGRGGLSREDRFSVGDWYSGQTGAPLLSAVRVAFECRLMEARPFGSHLILIGKVVETHSASTEESPLIYGDGTFLTAAAVGATG